MTTHVRARSRYDCAMGRGRDDKNEAALSPACETSGARAAHHHRSAVVWSERKGMRDKHATAGSLGVEPFSRRNA